MSSIVSTRLCQVLFPCDINIGIGEYKVVNTVVKVEMMPGFPIMGVGHNKYIYIYIYEVETFTWQETVKERAACFIGRDVVSHPQHQEYRINCLH